MIKKNHPTDINVMYPPSPLVGAKGDGKYDDTGTIKGCINYLDGKGGVIRFPVGTFRFTSKIVVPNGVTILGSGMRESHSDNTDNRPTSLLKDGEFDGIEIGYSSSLRELCVDGKEGNRGIGVRLMGNKSMLENVLVSRMGGDGVAVGHPAIDGNRNAWILRNVASVSNEGHGFVIDDHNPGYGPDANAGLAERSNAWGNQGDGWVIGRCAVNTFIQCYAEQNIGAGFRVKTMAMRNTFLNCGSERNIFEQFIFEPGSYNNLILGSNEFQAIDFGGNTVVRNNGGSSQTLNVSRVVKSGKIDNIYGGTDAGMQAVGNVPGYIFHEIDGPETKKTWDIIVNSGQMQIRLCDDDGKNPAAAITFNRDNKNLRLAKFNSILSAKDGLGIGNSTPATTLGNVAKKMQVFDENGNSIGFIPIYDSIN